jgi:hypothetical protein
MFVPPASSLSSSSNDEESKGRGDQQMKDESEPAHEPFMQATKQQ